MSWYVWLGILVLGVWGHIRTCRAYDRRLQEANRWVNEMANTLHAMRARLAEMERWLKDDESLEAFTARMEVVFTEMEQRQEARHA